jgi:RNA polymerase sigma-70 factor, ECF subfamily
MLSQAELIKGCKNFNRVAQQELYTKFSAKMRGLCIRYASNPEEAKDILQDGFIKVFSNIQRYAGTGSLEGWVRRVIVNTAISHYKKQKKHLHASIDELSDEDAIEDRDNIETENSTADFTFANLSQEELLHSLSILPERFRVVFNLYYMEDYAHKEIGDLLSIDEKTSRTRLFRARKLLQTHLQSICDAKINQRTNKR